MAAANTEVVEESLSQGALPPFADKRNLGEEEKLAAMN